MFAEEESHSISENTKWGIRKLFEDGKYSVAYSKFWGYDKGFVINEEQAAVIRKIFTLFLLGYSSEKIGKLLDGEGIKTICNAPQWSGATVISILHNEKYKGDALSQKFYVEDFRTKKKVKNETLPKYYVENGHECCSYVNTFAPPQKARKLGVS
jgi:DNA invertase Pin-like site-specific DNA recombinase